MNVVTKEVNVVLKNRYNSLVALAKRMPFEEILTGGDLIDWNVDPYRMTATFSGIMESGEKKEIQLNELDMLEVLKSMQRKLNIM